MWGAQVPLSSIWAVSALSCPLPGTAACPQCSGVTAVPLATLQCFVSLLGREELGTVWAAPPESPTCLGRIRGRGWGRDRGSHRSRAIPSSRGGKPGGAWAGPRSSGQSRSAAVGHSLPSPSLSPSAALKPQISARQRLERAEIRLGRACGRAQGAVAGMGSGAGAVRGDPRSGLSALPFPRRRLWRCGRRAGGGGVRRAAGRADADSERTFCSRKSR